MKIYKRLLQVLLSPVPHGFTTYSQILSQLASFAINGELASRLIYISQDVTIIQAIILRFYFYDVLERLKTIIPINFRFEKVFGFVIEYT